MNMDSGSQELHFCKARSRLDKQGRNERALSDSGFLLLNFCLTFSLVFVSAT